MRFLILEMDYSQFLQRLYAAHPGIETRSYEEQMRVRAGSLFGLADFYSANLRKLGHEGLDLYLNNSHLQSAWAREKGMLNGKSARLPQRVAWTVGIARRVVTCRRPRGFRRPTHPAEWRSAMEQARLDEILVAQVKHYKPDVLLNCAFQAVDGRILKELKPHTRVLVGQAGAAPPSGQDFGYYDLVVSSMPGLVRRFREEGLKSERLRLAFEPSILGGLGQAERTTPTSFVGSLSPNHRSRLQWLESLCSRLDVQVWGLGADGLGEGSSIRRGFRGQAWGRDMYRILAGSKITLNHHIDESGPFANNMRLFEATGVGALLVTDMKENLHEMFEPGKEVVAYRSPEECADLIRYYLNHDDEREAIARAGQARTLREHTYERRVKELVDIVQRHA